MNDFNYPIPVCESPILILNKRAAFLLQNGGKLFLADSDLPRQWQDYEYFLSHWYEYAQQYLYKDGQKYDIEALSRCCVTTSNFQHEFLFILAPCRHCEPCKESHRADLMHRAFYEDQLHDAPAWFVTLTYDKHHVGNGELRKKDLQDFLKRLRINTLRKHGIQAEYRYFACGEYGHDFGRPHFHLVLWNSPFPAASMNRKDGYTMRHLILDSWQQGIIQCDPVRGGASGYAAKYCCKQEQIMKKFNRTVKPFMLLSHGTRTGQYHYGIGKPFLMQRLNLLRVPGKRKFTFIHRFSGDCQVENYGHIENTCAFPSPSQLVHYKIHSNYSQYCRTLEYLVQHSLMSLQDARFRSELYRPFKNAVLNSFSYTRAMRKLTPELTYYQLQKIFPRHSKSFDHWQATINLFFLSENLDNNILSLSHNLERELLAYTESLIDKEYIDLFIQNKLLLAGFRPERSLHKQMAYQTAIRQRHIKQCAGADCQ